MLAGLAERGVTSMPLRWLATQGGHPQVPGVVAAIAGTLVWKSLAHKEISRITAEELPWWLELFGTMIGAAAPTAAHTAEGFCGIPMAQVLGQASVTELAAAALLGERPSADILDGFAMLTGLLLTNGPGAITAQGAKGAVSADGPQTPERIQLNKAMIGFLTHAGYAHGGNGFEGIAFLLERFAGTGLVDPGDPAHGVDLDALAKEYAVAFAELKTTRKELGADRATIPCINHPVFKGKDVNVDPREEFVRTVMAQRGDYNVFHDYYRRLVVALRDAGATTNVFCVNVDALIATGLLKMLWSRYRDGSFTEAQLENAAFTVFLFGRMIGCAAEIDDHQNRGRNMDTRSPAKALSFVS